MFLLKTSTITFLLFSLFSCASPLNDMMNNDFVALNPKPVPSHMAGIWSGSMGPYLTTFQWNKNGHGLYCYSWNTTEALQKTKYLGNSITNQDGTKLVVKSIDTDLMTLDVGYAFGKSYKFYRDNSLKNASPYCALKLKQ